MEYIFLTIFVVCFIAMLLDNDDEYKGHHDNRIGSYYETSHRNKTK